MSFKKKSRVDVANVGVLFSITNGTYLNSWGACVYTRMFVDLINIESC